MSSAPGRSQIRGLRPAGGDLLAEIRRKRRHLVVMRAVKIGTLGVVLLSAGVALKLLGDRSAVGTALEAARAHGLSGNAEDLRVAAGVLEAGLVSVPSNGRLLADRALVRAHLWLEFGEGYDQMVQAIDAAPTDSGASAIAKAVKLFGEGRLDESQTAIGAVKSMASEAERAEVAWLEGLLAIATAPDDRERLNHARQAIDVVLASVPENAALRRVRARLCLQMGEPDEALAELARAREMARGHLGLAADEALFNAFLRREPSGVASVAEQLQQRGDVLPPRDQSNTLLARGVVQVRSGETRAGLDSLRQAHEGLATWDWLGQRMIIEGALEAGAGELGRKWIAESGLPESERQVDVAWATLVEGDVMGALAQLAKLPQEMPRVAYLQALALTEQRRWSEARPWISRAEELVPDRVDLEVARARVEAHVGDSSVALRKLQALAEEEPWAPRAWTGLGEAWLMQADKVDLRAAQHALQRAIDREPLPAEALLLMAEVLNRKRSTSPKGLTQALELAKKAVETNRFLPRYREQYARLLVEAGYPDLARPLLKELLPVPGIEAATVASYVQLSIDANDATVPYTSLIEQARRLGADGPQLERLEAQVHMLHEGRDENAKAQVSLLGLVERRPDDIAARIALAETYVRQFDRKEAESILRRGFAHVPTIRQGRLLMAWADLEARTGKLRNAAARARAAWTRLLAEDRPASELLTAAELATRLWLRQGSNRVATTIAEQLVKRLPDHARAWLIRARTELNAGEAALARTSIDRSIALDPDDPQAHEVRGHCLLRFGNKDEARASYERALALADNAAAKARVRENLKRL